MLLFLMGCFQVDSEQWSTWEKENTGSIEAENQAPILSGVQISPAEEIFNDDSLSCTATAEDPEGGTVSLSYIWKNNGVQFATGQDVDLSGQDVEPNQEIACEVQAEDQEGATASETTSIMIMNREPEISSIVISNETPEADAELTCSAQAEDADGSEVTLSYVWTVDENELDFDENFSLIPENTLVGAAVRCTVSADDGSGGEISDYREVIVQNTLPEISSAAEIIATDPITTISEVRCSAEGTDLNDGELTPEYTWTNMRTSAVIGEAELLTLDASLALPNDTIRCLATVQDSQGAVADSIAEVVVNNAPPSFTQAAQITPSTGVYTDVELLCEAIAEDPEQGAMIPLYTWEVNGVVASSGETFVLTPSLTDVGDLITCRAEIEDAEGESDTSIVSVYIENTPPVINSVHFNPAQPEVEDLVGCIADITDIDSETPVITYAWDVGGASIGTNSPTLQLDPSMIALGDSLSCAVTVTDNAGDSDQDSTSATIQNTPPVVTQVGITPNTNVDTLSSLTCAATGFDINDGPLTPTYTWMNSGVQIGAGASITLDSSLALPGDTVTCVASVVDNQGVSNSSVSFVSVGNSLPIFTAPASITSNSGIYTGSVLDCFAAVTDSEDGQIMPTFVWEVEGVQVGTGSTYTILASESEVGDSITCIASVTDMHGDTSTSQETVVLENSEPVIDFVSIDNNTGNPIYNDDVVWCYGDRSDADEDELTTVGLWSSGGVEYGSGQFLDLATVALLPDDVLTCTITVTDTNDGIAEDQASITIQNRAPSVPSVLIDFSPTNFYPNDTEDLTCVGSDSTDPDGETVSYFYEWSSDTGASFIGDVLPSGQTVFGDSWTCTVTASDGNASETASESIPVLDCTTTACDFTLDVGGNEMLSFVPILASTLSSGIFSVSSHYYLMDTEVTQGMWYQLMGYQSYAGEATSNGTGSFGVGDDYPAYSVNWHMAADAANHATALHNSIYGSSLSECYSCSNAGSVSAVCTETMSPYACDGYRLPTEVEWVLASSVGFDVGFWTPSGGGSYSSNSCNGTESIIDSSPVAHFIRNYAWYCGNNNDGTNPYGSKPVGQLDPNGNRLYDMHGNISEWVADYAGNNCTFPEAAVDGFCGIYDDRRISRGAGWINPPMQLSNNERADYLATNRSMGFGFRLARSR